MSVDLERELDVRRGAAEWLVTPAVTVTRSCSENVARCSDTGVTLEVRRCLPSPIDFGVSVTPSGSRTPSAPCQPAR